MTKLLILNTGVGSNLGDRAMLINVVREIRAAQPSWRMMVSARTPRFVLEEFALDPVTFLYDCLDRGHQVQRMLHLPRLIGDLMQGCADLVSTLAIAMALLVCIVSGKRPSGRYMEADFVRSLLDADAVYFVGGGYLTDQGKRECRALLVTALFARCLRKPIVMSGQGVGPFRSFLSRWLFKRTAEYASLIGLRDAGQGMRLLESLNVSTARAETVADDALTLPPAYPVAPTPRALAVHWRVSPHQAETERVQPIIEVLLDRFAEEGWTIRLFQFHERPHYEASIYARWAATRGWPSVEIVQAADPRVLRAEIAKCSVGVGVAYHFSVFALAADLPVIGLWHTEYYREKIEGLMTAFGHIEWAKDDRRIDVDALRSQLLKMADAPANDEHRSRRQQLEGRHNDWMSRMLRKLDNETDAQTIGRSDTLV
ncbi:hypothetical protein GCM10025771_24910 [Niveibacterium umoris]|uniref:Polysaccharide pyruvyl transferase WcaK-like protein n=1 Tax=Niveibacterium umoris TaxID=1193620 RepID=A0A840BFL9_9RHOO|nr:polysaccharide pyruvyl transferase family protein [Niveibacterium umoris]MBB4012321.1 polysaccharide pyruvyl transferase WcaK-like protein [Niveibacterium umoris]